LREQKLSGIEVLLIQRELRHVITPVLNYMEEMQKIHKHLNNSNQYVLIILARVYTTHVQGDLCYFWGKNVLWVLGHVFTHLKKMCLAYLFFHLLNPMHVHIHHSYLLLSKKVLS
jgi:hypothetical protein